MATIARRPAYAVGPVDLEALEVVGHGRAGEPEFGGDRCGPHARRPALGDSRRGLAGRWARAANESCVLLAGGVRQLGAP